MIFRSACCGKKVHSPVERLDFACCCCLLLLLLNMVFGMFFSLLKLEVLRGIAQCDRSVDVRDLNVSEHGEKEKK